ncbi:hypothetical protein DF121_10250 [Burkholderia stagnalis]|nr:hypothetical protein DF145_23535 [Burkholderia stagnalis]RQY03312.1 hypothetical protein DF121_10250 [Burkholderia stagnalis]RQY15139.1 hypothetical protein DF115_17965 [Burkholderia stagnalis]
MPWSKFSLKIDRSRRPLRQKISQFYFSSVFIISHVVLARLWATLFLVHYWTLLPLEHCADITYKRLDTFDRHTL